MPLKRLDFIIKKGKLKRKVTEMTTLYLYYDSYVETTEPDTNDKWDRGSSYTTWSFNDIKLTKDKGQYYTESYKVAYEVSPGDTVYAMIAVWSTGDSFGNDDGACMEIMGIYLNEEDANTNAEILRNAGKSVAYTDGDGNKINLGFTPWAGYFECLDYISVIEFKVGS